ncbi:PspC domain-containing protein [Ulvibacter litoralis]|uniref:Phage shock protein PspC (Stress-responsive transcriptional regulator) n=1 Tax=Ulvibacter litoralis TaxID=227084 RepID=A0A1G7EY09_9FLAO|nr:PspC domain-containing protein [Ulvibacter litoralis]GHC53453.1 hypothetical protein GCM10008083_16840 [Ulvibacter litoralis]SDE68583.1 Phage shock protein PspC (stress-responsive transcriptional regulator) [Ulvibacter litoralis]
MKKTVNVNLAGTFFHIDEDAYGKLSRYLDAIRKSLSDPQGSDEIIRDIEARIAELFSEKIESSSQVISLTELDQVIAVMGQPEDYMVDEEIFEDASNHSRRKSSSTSYASSTFSKKLFRDVDDKFIAGVSSGLGHYLGIDVIWIRLIWVILVLASLGSPIPIYILLWILVPAAETTSDKLKMTGEPINISNIEKKFKEGYDNVADKLKNADYDKYGQKIKSGSSDFFETLGRILLTILKIFVKFIGVLLILVSISTLIGLIIGMFTFGSVDFWGQGEMMDYISLVDTSFTPIWLVSLLVLFAVGIPFFALFILGLKLLVDNLKSIGTTAKIVLVILWIASVIGLGILGIRQATEQAYDGDYITENVLPVRSGDTLKIAMRADTQYNHKVNRRNGIKILHNENNEKVIYSNDIRLIIRHTNEDNGKIVVEKKAEGSSFINAKNKAEAIDYSYDLTGNRLLLDGFFTTETSNFYRNQEIEIIVYLPIGTILFADENTYSFHRNESYYKDILDNGDEGHYLKILNNKTECLDCPSSEETTMERDTTQQADWEEEVNRNFNKGTSEETLEDRIILDENGDDVNLDEDKENTLQININN